MPPAGIEPETSTYAENSITHLKTMAHWGRHAGGSGDRRETT